MGGGGGLCGGWLCEAILAVKVSGCELLTGGSGCGCVGMFERAVLDRQRVCLYLRAWLNRRRDNMLYAASMALQGLFFFCLFRAAGGWVGVSDEGGRRAGGRVVDNVWTGDGRCVGG